MKLLLLFLVLNFTIIFGFTNKLIASENIPLKITENVIEYQNKSNITPISREIILPQKKNLDQITVALIALGLLIAASILFWITAPVNITLALFGLLVVCISNITITLTGVYSQNHGSEGDALFSAFSIGLVYLISFLQGIASIVMGLFNPLTIWLLGGAAFIIPGVIMLLILWIAAKIKNKGI